MITRRTEPRPIWVAAILLALLLAGALAACSAPRTAMADEPPGGEAAASQEGAPGNGAGALRESTQGGQAISSRENPAGSDGAAPGEVNAANGSASPAGNGESAAGQPASASPAPSADGASDSSPAPSADGAADSPATASADGAAKEAIPSVDKAVSTGGSFAKEAQVQAGTSLVYRLTATMPENVKEWDSLMYRIVDEPAEVITVDWSTVRAHLETRDGKRKADVQATASTTASGTVILFGDLKAADPDLAFGDVLVVEYQARVSPSAAAGLYRNVAHLDYLTGEAWKSTVKVETVVTVSSAGKAASGGTGGYDKTGDYLARFWPIAAIAGVALLTAGALMTASGRRARAKQDPTQPDGNANLQ